MDKSTVVKLVGALAFPVLLTLTTPALAATITELDPSFGTNGKVISADDSGDAVGVSISSDDQRIYVLITRVPAGGGAQQRILQKLNASGVLDTSFGTGGTLLLDDSGLTAVDLRGLVVDESAGAAYMGGKDDTAQPDCLVRVAKFNLSDGLRDLTYGGGDGIADVTVANTNGCGIDGPSRLQPDGSLFATGELGSGSSLSQAMLVKFTSAGVADTSFDGDGVALYPSFGGASFINEVVPAPSPGDLYLAASSATSFDDTNDKSLIARIHSDGALDTTFGTNGFTVVDAYNGGEEGFFRLRVQDSGDIVGIGGGASVPNTTGESIPDRIFMARFNSDGSLDTTFSGDGIQAECWPAEAQGYAPHNGNLQSDGRFILVGSTTTIPPQAIVVRVLGDAELSAAGGGDGVAEGDLSSCSLCAAGRLAFSASSFSVDEGLAGTVTVNLSGGSCPVSVAFSTSNWTARSGDYTPTSGVLSWAAGETGGKAFTVNTTQDALDEFAERVRLRLLQPVNATVGTPFGQLIIQDDDAPPTVTISPASASVTEGGRTAVVVSLSAPSGKPIRVRLSIGGSATRRSDYAPLSNVTLFGPGQTSKRLTLFTINDRTAESAETVVIQLGTPLNASLGTPSASTLTINDND